MIIAQMVLTWKCKQMMPYLSRSLPSFL